MGKYDPAPTLAAGLLRTARDKADMTQAELAAAAGVTQQAVSAYETGRKEPTMPTLQRLLAAAGYEMRIRLEPLDDHDASLETLMAALPPTRRAELEAATRERAAAARLRRTKGD
jgi:transcriptional regulator with XRE-family HTH domain